MIVLLLKKYVGPWLVLVMLFIYQTQHIYRGKALMFNFQREILAKFT